MADFTVRSDAVNVEQIMEQIRARIREKRGVDYTEEQIRELANVKLEKFLDPRVVRSDLLQEFQRQQATKPVTSNITFGPDAIFEARRPIVAKIRRLLHPVLRLFFNPDPISQALVRLNDIDPRADMYYELFHNLVIELTRTGIEVKNLKMRVESLTGRLEFNERRARALECVVVYKATGDEAPGPGQPAQGLHGSFQGSRGPQDSRGAVQGSRGSQNSRSSNVSQRSQTQGSAGAPPAPSHLPQGMAVPSAASESQPVLATGTAPPGMGQSGEGPGQRSRRRRRRRGRRGGGGSAAALMGASAGPADETTGTASPATDEAGADAHPSSSIAASTPFEGEQSQSGLPGDARLQGSPDEALTDSDPSDEQ
jgi:hypothetical protein